MLNQSIIVGKLQKIKMESNQIVIRVKRVENLKEHDDIVIWLPDTMMHMFNNQIKIGSTLGVKGKIVQPTEFSTQTTEAQKITFIKEN